MYISAIVRISTLCSLRKNVISLVTVEKYFVKTINVVVYCVCNLVLNQLISRIFASMYLATKSVQLHTFKIHLPYIFSREDQRGQYESITFFCLV